MAQGRKTHFLYDLKEILAQTKMPEAQWRSFGETLFAKGARVSTEDAKDWLLEKVEDNTITMKDAEQIAGLVERYSFWR